MARSDSFEELVTERGFDRYQSGLVVRFQAYRLEYKLSYGEPTAKPCLWMDFSSERTRTIGRVTLWESGECDLEVIDSKSGDDILRETHSFSSPDLFFSTYPKVPILMRGADWSSDLGSSRS